MRSPWRSSAFLSYLLRKITASFVVAAFLGAAPGLPFYKAFAEGEGVSIEGAAETQPMGAAVVASPSLAGPQTLPGMTTLPRMAAPIGVAFLQPPQTTPNVPAAAAAAPSSLLVSQAGAENAPEFYRLASGFERADSLQVLEILTPPSEPGLEAAAAWGRDSFQRMFAGSSAQAAAPVVAAPAPERALPAPAFSFRPAHAAAAMGVAALVIAPSALAATGAAVHGSADAWLAASGSAASVLGNVLAVSYPFFKMAKLYKVRRVSQKKSVSADVLAFGASMLNASIAMEAGLSLSGGASSLFSLAAWGMQNLVGGMALLANAALTRRFQRRPEDARPARALRNVLATGAAVVGLSALVYAAGAGWVMPGLAPKLDAATAWATVGHLSRFRILANIVSVGAFTYLMVPEAVYLWRTKDAGEHSKGYYLGGLLAKLALGYWSWTMAMRLPGADPEHARHILNMWVYPVSAIPAAVAYTLARRYSKTKKP